MIVVSINIDYLTKVFFYFDEPVPYKVEDGKFIEIKPVTLRNSEIFLTSADILTVDKNSYADVNIIQMSYLQFLIKVLIANDNSNPINELNRQKFVNILILCLGLKFPMIEWIDENTPCIVDKELEIKITPKQFDDIRKIIMYQNIVHYDDDYINPEFKKAMMEEDELRNRNKVVPSLERKMAIITAHSGLSKKEQQEMTYRSHCILFDEVCGEVEFTTVRPISLLGGKDEMEHWIFKNQKGKFDDYMRSVDSYSKSMGGGSAIRTADSNIGDEYMALYNKFK